MKKGLLIVLLLLCATSFSYGDTIILKNGNKIKGIAYEKDQEVEVEQYFGAGMMMTKYAKDEIKEIIKDGEEVEQILQEHNKSLEEEKRKKEVEESLSDVYERQGIKSLEEMQQESDQFLNDLRERNAQMERDLEQQKKEAQKRERELEYEKRKFKFGDVSIRSEYGFTDYEGIIYNNGREAKDWVKVKIIFYDSKRNFLTSQDTYTDPKYILAGSKATFKISIPDTYPVATYEMSATWR